MNDKMAVFLPKKRPVEFLPDPRLLRMQAQSADVALVTIGRTSGEFKDQKLSSDFDLTENEQKYAKLFILKIRN